MRDFLNIVLAEILLFAPALSWLFLFGGSGSVWIAVGLGLTGAILAIGAVEWSPF